jgi:hypothetical protein
MSMSKSKKTQNSLGLDRSTDSGYSIGIPAAIRVQ